MNFEPSGKALVGSVGFVPTMGALHDGHISLIAASVADNEHTILSIYVNPTQFNNPDDLENYPSTMQADLDAAQQHGVDMVILPSYDDMYADGYRYQVTENEFSMQLCGGNRPGHFTGVMTVVMKLLNLVKAQRAYFGEKDHQQLKLITDMSEAFFMDVEIVGCPTIRESDGLAMSSRNKMLDVKGRQLAPEFSRLLHHRGCDDSVIAALEEQGFDVDYIVTKDNRRYGAVVVSCDGLQVRLIDNVELQKFDGGMRPHDAHRSLRTGSVAAQRHREIDFTADSQTSAARVGIEHNNSNNEEEVA